MRTDSEHRDGARRLADAIEAHRGGLLAAYEEMLESLGNPIVEGELSLSQALQNADQILTDVVESLRAGEVRVAEAYRSIAWGIGVTRAAAGVHPADSLQASSVYFRTVLSSAAEYLTEDPESFELFGMVALALERSITMRVRTALAGYTSFLLNQVHEAQVNERRRIARELHDRIGHCISVTHRQLELFNLYQNTDPAKASQKVETAQRAIRESMQNLRAVTSDLYAVEPLKSLDTALMNFLSTADTEGVDVRVRVNGDESWAGPEVLDETFLVLREAVHNALRHAAPTTVIINVDITPREIRAFVEDDGRGFDPEKPPRSGGVGLSSMRERARLLSGSLAVRSRAGQGTHIDFAVPLRPEADVDGV